MRYMQNDSMSIPGETITSTLTISEGCNPHCCNPISSLLAYVSDRLLKAHCIGVGNDRPSGVLSHGCDHGRHFLIEQQGQLGP